MSRPTFLSLFPGLILIGIGAFVTVANPQVQKDEGHKLHEHGDKDTPRMKPGPSGPVGSPKDRGKLVPGNRAASLSPMPVMTPDLPKLEHKMVDGAKEFHLHIQPVKRE